MNMKKLIATALAVVMIFGLVSVGFAAAVEFPDIEDHEYASSIEKLATLEVIQGYPDGTFKPDDRVKRSEFAKMIVIMLGLEETAELFEGMATVFPDVPGSHWASGYITVAHSLGIINGYPDGTFKPEKEITYHEALKMILTAMGYLEEGFKTVRWPVTWVMKAAEVKIDTGVPYLGDLPITRAQVAKLLDNSLTKPHVTVQAEGGFSDPEKSKVTFLSKLGVDQLIGIVVDSPELWTNTTGKIKVGTKSFEYEDYEGLLGHKVRVWYKDSAIIDLVDLSTEEVVDADDWATVAKDFTDNVKPFVNYTPATKWVGEVYKKVEWNGIPKELDLTTADEIVVVYDEKDDPIAVKALIYTPATINSIHKDNMAIYVDGGSTRLDLKVAEVEYKGIASTFEDLEKDQSIYYIYYKGSTTPKIAARAIIEVEGDTVTGVLKKVTSGAGDYVISLVVEDKTYSAKTQELKSTDVKPHIGKEVKLYFDRYGKVTKVVPVKPAISDWFVGLITAKASDADGDYVTIFTEEDYAITVPYENGNPKVGDAVYAKIYTDDKIHFGPTVTNSVYVAVYKAVIGVGKETTTGKVYENDTNTIKVRYVVEEVYEAVYTFHLADETLWLQKISGGYEVRTKPPVGKTVEVYLLTDKVILGIVY